MSYCLNCGRSDGMSLTGGGCSMCPPTTITTQKEVEPTGRVIHEFLRALVDLERRVKASEDWIARQ